MLCYVCDVKDRVFSFYKNEDMSKPSVGRPFSVDEDTFTAKSIKLRKQNIILKDTCAFDSLIQIILTASYDFVVIQKQVSSF